MLTYTLTKDRTLSLYEQLYRCIKADILGGILKTDERLPSKRNFAQHLKVSVMTVENAYAQLITEGYIYAVEKKGYFVSKIEEVLHTDRKGYPVKEDSDITDYYMDFQKNSISSEDFPFTVWAKTMREVILVQNKKLLQPMQYNGILELREAISDYLLHFRGISVDPSQIILGAGTEYLYNLIVQLLGNEKTYAVENPGYTKITHIYEVNHVCCEHIDIDENGLSVDMLRRTEADVVHISPSHHYPTGIVMPVGRRQALLKWAGDKSGRYIMEDDYDSEFRFSGKPIQTLYSIDDNERVIYINTFSKTIAPSIRISYMILPSHLLEKYKQELDFYSCTVPSFEQYTLAKFISRGSFEQHINRMKKIYRSKRDAVISAIQQSPFSDIVSINEEQAGLHFLLKVSTDMSDRDLRDRAAKNGICLAFMSDYLFLADSKYDHILVVNYSGIEINNLPVAMEKLAAAIK